MRLIHRLIIPCLGLILPTSAMAQSHRIDFDTAYFIPNGAGALREAGRTYYPNYEGKSTQNPRFFQWRPWLSPSRYYVGSTSGRVGLGLELAALSVADANLHKKGRMEYVIDDRIPMKPSGRQDLHAFEFSFNWPTTIDEPWSRWVSSYDNWCGVMQVWQRDPLSPPLAVMVQPVNSNFSPSSRLRVRVVANSDFHANQTVAVFDIDKSTSAAINSNWHTIRLETRFSWPGDNVAGRVIVRHKVDTGSYVTRANWVGEVGYKPIGATNNGVNDSHVLYKIGLYRGSAAQTQYHAIYYDNVRYSRSP